MAEWRRVFQKKQVWLVATGLLMLNLLLYFYSMGLFDVGVSGIAKRISHNWKISGIENEYYAEWSGLSVEEMQLEVRNRLEQEGLTEPEQEALRSMGAYLGILFQYPYTLQEVQTNAEQMKATWEDKAENAFAIRNIDKTAADYRKLERVKLAPGNYFPLYGMMKSGYTAYLAMIFGAVLVLVFLEERKRGLWNFVYAMPKGRVAMAVQRTGILAAGTFVFSVLLWLENILLLWINSGAFGDWSQSIQSVLGFQSVMLRVSVLGYVAIYIVSLSLVAVLFVCLVWVFSAYPKNPVFGIGVMAIVLTAEYVLWTAVPKNSSAAIFRFLNLFAWNDMDRLLNEYWNLNVLGRPVESFTVFVAAFPVVFVIVLLLCSLSGKIRPIRGGGRKWNAARFVPHRLEQLGGSLKWFVTQRLHETYKQMKVQGAFFVIAAAIVLCVRGVELRTVIYSAEVSLYLDYIDALKGPYVPQKKAYLESERETVQGLLEELRMTQGEESPEYREMKQKDNMLASLIDVSEQYEMWTAKGIYPEYVSKIGYDRLYGTGADEAEEQHALFIAAILILTSAGLFAYERQQGMDVWIRTMPHGRGRVRRRKYGLMALCAVGITLLVYGCEFYEVWMNYGLTGLDSPLQSVPAFLKLPYRINVGTFLAILYGLRILASVALGFVILLISEHSVGILQSLIKSVLILLAPACMVFLGADVMRTVSIFFAMCLMERYHATGNLTGSGMAGWVILMLLACGAIVLQARKDWRKKAEGGACK